MHPTVKITPKEFSEPETVLNEWAGRLQLASFSGVIYFTKTDEVNLGLYSY